MLINCPICAQGQINQEVSQQNFEYQGKIYTVPYKLDSCNNCGSVVQSGETIKENLQARKDVVGIVE